MRSAIKDNTDLPKGWKWESIIKLIDKDGLFADGDWIESKDQDPNGQIRLIQLADIGDGYFIDKSNRFVNNETAKRLRCTFLNKGDLLVARMPDPLGRCCIFPINNFEKYITVVDVCIIRCSKRVLSEYLMNMINSPSIRLKIWNEKSGTTRSRITKTKLGEIKIPLPPLPEQQRIVEKLDRLFANIDTAIALSEENLQHTNNLLPAALNEVFENNKYKEILLSDVCILNPPKSETRLIEDIDVSFVPMADLKEKKKYFEATQIKKLKDVYTGYTYFKESDVLLAKVTPCFENGKSGIAKNLTNKIGFGSSEYYVFRASNKILPEWIYYNISSDDFLKQGANNMSGAVGLKRVTKDFINSWKIKLPDIPTQQKIVQHLNALSAQQQQLQQHYTQQLQQLKALKASLLHAAFKGEL